MKKREQGEARVDRGWYRDGFDVTIILVLHSDRARGSRKKRARLEPPSRAHTNANDYCATAEWKATLEKFIYPKEKRAVPEARFNVREKREHFRVGGWGGEGSDFFFLRTIFSVQFSSPIFILNEKTSTYFSSARNEIRERRCGGKFRAMHPIS